MTQTGNKPPNFTPDNLPLIRANELTQYSFCRRAWWLGTIKKVQPDRQNRLAHGLQVHARHEHQVRRAIGWRRFGLLLMGLGCLFLVAMLLLWLGGG